MSRQAYEKLMKPANVVIIANIEGGSEQND